MGGEGQSILKHILGNNQASVENGLSQSAGLQPNQMGQILQILAPIVLGALSRQTRQQGLDIGGLAGLLQNTVSQEQQNTPQAFNIISSLMDRRRKHGR